MKIAGRWGAMIGVGFSIMTLTTTTFAHEEICDFQGLVSVKQLTTVKKSKRLPRNSVLKVQLIEAAIFDVNAPVIAGDDIDVSGHYFPLKFNMNLDCEKIKRTIMPSFNIRVELADKLLFSNDSMHPFSQGEALQKIELIEIH